MNVFYMSTALTDETYEYIVNNCKSFKPTYSGVGFDRNIAEGLAKHTIIKLVSLAPIPSYPKYKNIIWNKKIENSDINNYYIPAMINVPILKELWYMTAALVQMIKWKRKSDSLPKVIVISGLFRCYIIPSLIIKMLFNIKVYAIVPDVPEVMSTYRRDYSKLRKFLNTLEIKIGKSLRKKIDGYILLTEHMNPVVNVKGSPYIVVDGMFKEQKESDISTTKDKTDKKTIMYAGKLSKQFGIDKLISAFLMADIDNSELLLYGDGDYVPEITNIIRDHKNILYGGVVSHKKILEEEKRVDLLVDPRPSDLILSKMAFPSKIIEYMASGTPVLTTNLPCFGKEYVNYQYRFNAEDVDSMASKLREVLSLEKIELELLGINAKNFILSEKTVERQCERILDFIDNQI